MEALPIPEPGGSLDDLKRFLNVKSSNDLVLTVSFLLAALRNRGPYPVIALAGEQGSAKSTFACILKKLVDPNTAGLRTPPRSDHDLFIAANNGYLLAYDNVSAIPVWLSDALCRLSTGGAFAVRALDTDADEVLFQGLRPTVLNGIDDFITRPDLADRSVFLTLEPIREENRRPENELWTAFKQAHPRILGVLLDGVVKGLAMLPQTRLQKLPRMADFALWATACETAFWPTGTFAAAYAQNQEKVVEGVVESDPVAVALRALIEKQTTWTGTATALIPALAAVVPESHTRAKEWPSSAKMLSVRLRRAATFLRKVGIEVDYGRQGHDRRRTIHVSMLEGKRNAPSAVSAGCAATDGTDCNDDLVDVTRSESNTPGTIADGADEGSDSSVRSNFLKTNGKVVADDADAVLRPLSGEVLADASMWKGRI